MPWACLDRTVGAGTKWATFLDRTVGAEDEMVGLLHDLALSGESADFFLVPGKGEAFVGRTGDLALEFADTPLIVGGFDFIKSAFVRGIDGEEFDVVGPTEGEAAEEIFH